MTTDQMTAHLEALAADHGVTLEWAGSSGRAWRRIRRVRTPVIKSDVTYAIALHEFGHVLGEQSGRRMDQEVQAWAWARVNARVWTDRMDRTRGTASAPMSAGQSGGSAAATRSTSQPTTPSTSWRIRVLRHKE